MDSAQLVERVAHDNRQLRHLTRVKSPRQESNLYLALRRHSFYPLNYGERRCGARSIGGGREAAGRRPSRPEFAELPVAGWHSALCAQFASTSARAASVRVLFVFACALSTCCVDKIRPSLNCSSPALRAQFLSPARAPAMTRRARRVVRHCCAVFAVPLQCVTRIGMK